MERQPKKSEVGGETGESGQARKRGRQAGKGEIGKKEAGKGRADDEKYRKK
jgi:hypothetical protein